MASGRPAATDGSEAGEVSAGSDGSAGSAGSAGSTDVVLVRHERAVAVITLNRPQVLNAMTRPTRPPTPDSTADITLPSATRPTAGEPGSRFRAACRAVRRAART